MVLPIIIFTCPTTGDIIRMELSKLDYQREDDYDGMIRLKIVAHCSSCRDNHIVYGEII